jgi:hypothetical protein
MLTVYMVNGTVFAHIKVPANCSGRSVFLAAKFYCGHPAKYSRVNACQIPLLGTNAVRVFIIIFGATTLRCRWPI